MTALTGPINASTGAIPVDSPLGNPSYPIFYDLDAETIKVIGYADTNLWDVERGVANTQAVHHGRGTTLVSNASPYGGGGGSISATDGTNTVTGVTNLQVTSVTDGGGGTAVVNNGGGTGVPDSWTFNDEGEVSIQQGAGSNVPIAIYAPDGTTPVYRFGVTGWTIIDSSDPGLAAFRINVPNDQSAPMVSISNIAGDQYLFQYGNGRIEASAALGATFVLRLWDGNNTKVFDVGAGGVGFNGAAQSIPVVPATPTAQDVVNALVALGLITQAP